jgi:hypothetical protein
MADPIGNREGAELGEITVVEHQHESAGARPDPLDRMAVPAGEVPDVSGPEINDLAPVLWIDGGDAAASFDHIRPFGGVGMPVQLAQGSRLECHINAGKLLRDRKLLDIGFLGGAALEALGRLRAEPITERR